MKLKGFKVAILACDGFEETEMTKPKKALENEKASVYLIAPKTKKIKSWLRGNWHHAFSVNHKLENIKPEHYDALILPGGVINPDQLRTNRQAIRFIDHFFKKNKPIAAICHGPLPLVETKRLNGRKLTSYHSIKTDLLNAGAKWVNKPVVVDRNLITSRKPNDLPAFIREIKKLFATSKKEKAAGIKSLRKLKEISPKPFIK